MAAMNRKLRARCASPALRFFPPAFFRKSAQLLALALAALLWGSAHGPAAAQEQESAARRTATIGQQLEPPHLDPTSAAAGAIDQIVYANVLEGLTRFRADGSIAPALARDWTISDDGLVYRFALHDGIRFHDGTTLDAGDVKFSLDRARAENSTNAQKALFADIQAVEVVDRLTVEITLSQPSGAVLWNLAWGDAVIVAPESAESLKTLPIGTGPFRFAGWRRGDSVTLDKNPDYWGKTPALERVTFKFISDPTAALAAVMAGDVDAFPAFPAPENLAQLGRDPRLAVTVGSTEGETILAINNKKAPLSDVRLRQAIAHAIDRAAIIEGATFGYGTPIGTHFAPHHPDYVDLTDQSRHDPDLARQLLGAAGFAGGLELSLKLPPPSYARRSGEIIAAQLRAVGIKTRITNLEWAQWLEEVFRAHDYDLTIVSHTEPLDIGIYARPDYYFGYDNPALQALAAELAATSDAERRSAFLQQAQEIIAGDYVNAWLFQLPNTSVANKNLKGLWKNAPTQAADMTGVYWQE